MGDHKDKQTEHDNIQCSINDKKHQFERSLCIYVGKEGHRKGWDLVKKDHRASCPNIAIFGY